MNTKMVQNTEDWHACRRAWNALLAHSPSNHVFLTYEWLSAWWEVYGQNKELRILLIEENDALVAIAPLYREKKTGLGPGSAATLRLLGDQIVGSDFLNLIVQRGRERDAIDAVLTHLRRERDWDVLLLVDLDADSTNVGVLRDLARKHGLCHFKHRRFSCPCLELPDNWDDFMAIPDALFKKIVRSKAVKKLAKQHAVELCRAEDTDQANQYLTDMFRLHAERWHNQGKTGVFDDDMQRFYRRATEAMQGTDWLRLWALRVDDNIEVVEFGLAYADSYYALQGGCSAAGLKLRAGHGLQYRIFESLTGNTRTLHMLRGRETYKYQWGCVDKYTCQIGLSNSLKGCCALSAEAVRHVSRTLIKATLAWLRNPMPHRGKPAPA